MKAALPMKDKLSVLPSSAYGHRRLFLAFFKYNALKFSLSIRNYDKIIN